MISAAKRLNKLADQTSTEAPLKRPKVAHPIITAVVRDCLALLISQGKSEDLRLPI
ncbi:hypothetical protein [Streptococcus merionis]|uniref:hypothetical protein n=1 Tax=Streptococcus merionis TaxID=400065 RepID=UPI0012EA1562|nr:hypothetical protein [Streptococcus merionis]